MKLLVKTNFHRNINNRINLLCGTSVSCVETMIALSLADNTTVKQTRCSSRLLLMFLTRVSSRTQCGSERGSEYFSTHIQVEYVRPVCGGNTRSPVKYLIKLAYSYHIRYVIFYVFIIHH